MPPAASSSTSQLLTATTEREIQFGAQALKRCLDKMRELDPDCQSRHYHDLIYLCEYVLSYFRSNLRKPNIQAARDADVAIKDLQEVVKELVDSLPARERSGKPRFAEVKPAIMLVLLAYIEAQLALGRQPREISQILESINGESRLIHEGVEYVPGMPQATAVNEINNRWTIEVSREKWCLVRSLYFIRRTARDQRISTYESRCPEISRQLQHVSNHVKHMFEEKAGKNTGQAPGGNAEGRLGNSAGDKLDRDAGQKSNNNAAKGSNSSGGKKVRRHLAKAEIINRVTKWLTNGGIQTDLQMLEIPGGTTIYKPTGDFKPPRKFCTCRFKWEKIDIPGFNPPRKMGCLEGYGDKDCAEVALSLALYSSKRLDNAGGSSH
ncbi:hypothetical protein F4777DRAFT_396145 [Nemania sp. FL0916]|nr:hypothetical protein F4777DRAFT_396145 [Nemania sp. FL0916]